MRRLRSASDSRSSARGLDVHHGPVGIERVGQALAGAHQLLRLRIRADGDEDRDRRRAARARDPAGSARAAASTRSATRRSASSRSAMRLGLRKKRSTAVAPRLHVDLAGVQAREQVIRRQIDQLDFVGLVEDAIGQGLALAHAGDLGDQVVQALQVLDVDGGPDVDAGIQQLLDVLPALGVARRRLAADEVGVRQLIDQQDGGMPLRARHRDRIPDARCRGS